MDRIFIIGGSKLTGEVEISGSKNAVLPIMAGTLIQEGVYTIRNIPILMDVLTMAEVLKNLGAKINFEGNSVTIDTRGQVGYEAPYELVKKMRASYYVLGPLVSRLKRARVSLPGGCVLGPRPVDLHIRGLKSLSVNIDIVNGYIEASCEKIIGNTIYLEGEKGPSVGATINTIFAATRCEGETIINGAAIEPEVVDVVNFLKKMGAKIEGEGTKVIKIKGVKELNPTDYEVIPDRIEAGTFLAAAMATGGELTLKNVIPEHLHTVLDKLKESGAKIYIDKNSIRINGENGLKPIDIIVGPYPEFPTDLQPQFTSMLLKADGLSMVKETIFENRFMHIPELIRMGADIKINDDTAIIKGGNSIKGAPVMASDIRCGAALIIAGLIANGETSISRVYHIDRGYENIDKKLEKLGAKIWRVRE
uniref:UDP-N-acetylglucosamine 1-carboxyvinyltransferase n=1 Tax=candidate division WOR-3 bacterium TaxID=2052148 RepID=A0A7C3UPX3_UNCW3